MIFQYQVRVCGVWCSGFIEAETEEQASARVLRMSVADALKNAVVGDNYTGLAIGPASDEDEDR